jgi:hypothetical protein
MLAGRLRRAKIAKNKTSKLDKVYMENRKQKLEKAIECCLVNADRLIYICDFVSDDYSLI